MKPQNEVAPLTRNEVAALDIATHTGYYCLTEGGTWDFTESMRRNNNKQHKAFRDTLIDFIQRNGIRQIVAEDVSVNNHSPIRVNYQSFVEFYLRCATL